MIGQAASTGIDFAFIGLTSPYAERINPRILSPILDNGK